MKLFNFYNKSVYIQYRNQLCSTTTVVVCALTLAAFAVPYYLLSSIRQGELWDQQRTVYEQPKMSFQYSYLFLAEMEDPEEGRATSASVVTCSSFPSYNTLTEQLHPCSDVQVIPTDTNHDHTLDHLSVSISFNPPDRASRLSFYTFYFFLEATVSSQCRFVIPAFVSLEKVPPPAGRTFLSGTIVHSGLMATRQTVALQCPFFMRHQQSHFSDRYYPNENTTLDGFQPRVIRAQIEAANPAYYEYRPQHTDWTMDGSGTVRVQVDVAIGGNESTSVALLYKTSLWWKLCQFWGSYFPLLIVSLWLAEKCKQYLFERFFLRAVEVVPWKNKYN
uniref:Transmembrane protein 231 n=1 Tax=Anopheles coluzzii TaxID=1518534 RepID=A0A6E8VWD5_ANOCL|nr:transmembrane protein 231 [Anopheles coluzzii]